MQPSVGRIVHYRETVEAECQAAIVVRAWSEDTVNLAVIRDGSNDFQQPGLADLMVVWKTSIQREDVSGGSSWHWPERVEEQPTLDTRGDAP